MCSARLLFLLAAGVVPMACASTGAGTDDGSVGTLRATGTSTEASGGSGAGGAGGETSTGKGAAGGGTGGAAGSTTGSSSSSSTSSTGDCVPACAEPCADDGCGGVCETCGPGKVCVEGACACDPTLPAGWPSFVPYAHNPIIVPSKKAAAQGADNIYAPEVLLTDGLRFMWYGGQGGDGHDRIFFAWSKDGYSWQKYPSGASPAPVLDVGGSNHVNDPSVVFSGGEYRMYYTDADAGINDRIWLAVGSSPTSFTKSKKVIDIGLAGSWESVRVGRPAVLFEGGVYRMWYDGSDGVSRHVGYAESADGLTFAKHPQNPVFLNAGAVDVKKVGGVYVMLREAGDGTYFATSKDGLCWVDRGKLVAKSGGAYDAFGQVTPFLAVENDQPVAVLFGGASGPAWNKNRVAIAHPVGAATPAAGCTGCLPPGSTCAEACAGGKHADYGVCGKPGSVDPDVCCACVDDGCGGCIPAGSTCHAACVGGGHAGGFCGKPGSQDPSACCACF